MRYQFIQGLLKEFSLSVLCRVMQVSRAGFFAWKRRQARGPSAKELADQRITAQLKESFRENLEVYGSPRLWKEVLEKGIACGRHRVARLMKAAGLCARAPRRFVVTTDSKHSEPVAENLLSQDFGASEADVKWASDITYVWTSEGWLYLSVVLDLFSRRVIGWSMQASLHKGLVLDALSMALDHRRPSEGLVHHSDRGCQYASTDYQRALSEAGIVCSMSRKGNCWDNAAVESFFGTLKTELVHRMRFATRDAARKELFGYIEIFYNRRRRHSALGYLSPCDFESRHRLRQLVPA